MRRILGLIFNRWVLLALGLLAIGPAHLVGRPDDRDQRLPPASSRSGCAGCRSRLVVADSRSRGWRGAYLKARRANAGAGRRPRSGRPAADARPDPAAAEVAQLRQRFEEALGLLRKLRFGAEKPSLVGADPRARLAAVPLRAALVRVHRRAGGRQDHRAGQLRTALPPRRPARREAVRGVGGTRNCDWWFTDEAVFLDTAGRYTTQESRPGRRRRRPGRASSSSSRSRARAGPSTACWSPSASATCCSSRPAEREAQAAGRARARARALRGAGRALSRLRAGDQERPPRRLQRVLRDLGKEERAQVWGFSLPLRRPGRSTPPRCRPSSSASKRRLYERLPERLEEERDPARRALIYGFPQQFALLRDRLVALRRRRLRAHPVRDRARSCAASTSPAAPRKEARSTA